MTPVVGIVWRNDPITDPTSDDDKTLSGKGAFWDHYTLQTMLNVPTYIIPWREDLTETIKCTFCEYLEKHCKDISIRNGINEQSTVKELKTELEARGFKSSRQNKIDMWERLGQGKPKLPHIPTTNDGCPEFRSPADVDIIVIPGVTRGGDEADRAAFEKQLLRDYAFRGKRFILLCGGVWRLEALGVRIGESKDHSYSKMISLNSSGEIINNVAVHNVEILQNATTESIWPTEIPTPFAVNSVHADAIIDLGEMKDQLEVVAKSTTACGLQNRNGNVMKPVPCIEAVASKNPGDYRLVAIQWHPEAYCKEKDSVHKQLLNFVVNVPVPASAHVVESIENVRMDSLRL